MMKRTAHICTTAKQCCKPSAHICAVDLQPCNALRTVRGQFAALQRHPAPVRGENAEMKQV